MENFPNKFLIASSAESLETNVTKLVGILNTKDSIYPY